MQLSRRRILVIFLLIRYTGAKLNEILALNPLKRIDFKRQLVDLGNGGPDARTESRTVRISAPLASELEEMFNDPSFRRFLESNLILIPGLSGVSFMSGPRRWVFQRSLAVPK